MPYMMKALLNTAVTHLQVKQMVFPVIDSIAPKRTVQGLLLAGEHHSLAARARVLCPLVCCRLKPSHDVMHHTFTV